MRGRLGGREKAFQHSHNPVCLWSALGQTKAGLINHARQRHDTSARVRIPCRHCRGLFIKRGLRTHSRFCRGSPIPKRGAPGVTLNLPIGCGLHCILVRNAEEEVCVCVFICSHVCVCVCCVLCACVHACVCVCLCVHMYVFVCVCVYDVQCTVSLPDFLHVHSWASRSMPT